MSVSILTVDDEADVADLFQQHSRREVREGRYVLHFASSAKEALAKLADGIRPQLIVILRHQIPGVDGLMLLRQIRGFADLRILFWIKAAMIGAVFLIEISARRHLFQVTPIVLSGITAAFGLTVAGAITAMQGLSREMAEVNLLVLLAGEVDVTSLEGIVAALVTKLTNTSPRQNLGHRVARSRA